MTTTLKLHLGCAGTVVPGWTSTSRQASIGALPTAEANPSSGRSDRRCSGQGFPPGIIHADVSRRLPYADGSVAFVYSSHLIEHLSRPQGLDFVRECRRVLRLGGIMRVATPDLEAIVETYITANGATDGQQTRADAMMEQPACSTSSRPAACSA